MVIWQRREERQRREQPSWEERALGRHGLAIRRADRRLVLEPLHEARGRALALVVPFVEAGVARALLLAAPGAKRVWVAGWQPIAHVLEPRSELRIEGESLWFGSGARETVVAYASQGRELLCARCSRALESGDRVARSACCSAWFHAGVVAREPREKLGCLDYDPKCSACGRSRESTAWSPESVDA